MTFLLLRRATQLGLILLYVSAFSWNQQVLVGNLSASSLFDKVILADPFAVLQMLLAGIELDERTLIGATIILAFYALIAGRSFCSWVCPVNMLTDLAAWIKRRVPMLNKGGRQTVHINRDFRFWVLGLSLILSAVFGMAAFEAVSPVSLMHRGLVYGFGVMGIIVLGAIFLFDLLIQRNGFCGHICPLGAFYTLTTRINLVRIRYDRDSCSDCMDCKVVCPERQVLDMIGHQSAVVTKSACTNCGRCIDVCPDSSLGFVLRTKPADFRRYKKEPNLTHESNLRRNHEAA
ncbi:MAG: quinol dehydrogenase ferredoxin subunit NapH [Gammaproteobacteria bacterium]|nr:quinol dehydrogenase ferredoxin subunit NapH [Gammaproteobacteria bacterium]MBT4494083.1 quinol dehydrogenase ferredoxin subunit NapH [Gammaproteobacteria bacterium]MBT7369324.1 quinol dehydrogenase ferredoxin subunit NapH [Gammaproteobacteria bacterium]